MVKIKAGLSLFEVVSSKQTRRHCTIFTVVRIGESEDEKKSHFFIKANTDLSERKILSNNETVKSFWTIIHIIGNKYVKW